MKKSQMLLLFFYAGVTVFCIVTVILDSFGLTLQRLAKDWFSLQQFIFSIVLLTISLTAMLIFISQIADYNSKRLLNRDLRRIMSNQPISRQADTDLGTTVTLLSEKMQQVTRQLQNTVNRDMLDQQEVIQKERKRIARDLHDTVSQELFASSMMISGLSASLDYVEKKQLQDQLIGIEGILNKAQSDLRVLLLHLRPTELEGKTLSQGLEMILRELTDKSGIEVVYKEQIDHLPKTIEANLFRIAQEFISNTLRHAKATCLEVYLEQTPNQVQLKMLDNGIGFDLDKEREMSYGLKNIEERVTDMAGVVKLMSAKNKGVSMDIRIPLVEGEEDGKA